MRTTCAENPHDGDRRLPFMNRTTGWSETSVDSRFRKIFVHRAGPTIAPPTGANFSAAVARATSRQVGRI